MWCECLGDNGDGGCLAAGSVGAEGMEGWDAEMKAAVMLDEDGACTEVAPSAQQMER